MSDLLPSIPSALRRSAKLSLADWVLLVQLGLFSLFVSVQLYDKPLSLIVDRLTRQAYRGDWLWVRKAAHDYEIPQLARLTNIAARFSLGVGHCLMRSLLLFWLLHARGETVNLCLGVRKDHETLHGHAWIETKEGMLADTAELAGQFVTVLRF